jgi:uncharacterized protein YndB with AHSA1/START domain
VKSQIHLESVYPHPIETVWEAISNRESLSAWLMPTDDFLAVIGHTFHFRTKPALGFDGVVQCEILEVQAPWRLSFSWQGGPLQRTVVTFELRSDGHHTHLRLLHQGFKGLLPMLTANVLRRGWVKLITQSLLRYLDFSQRPLV